MIRSLSNLQGNVLAAVDVETTGRQGGFHEIVQIAVVPLTLDLDPADASPFYCNMQPLHPDRAEKRATDIHGLQLDDLLLNAPTPDRVLDHLLQWFSELPLGHGRRLTPIAHNFAFERSFLVPWLGLELFDSIFVPQPRDTMIFCSMLNDRASFLGLEPPFPYTNLVYVCKLLGIPLQDAHNALEDSMSTAKLYQTLLRSL